MPLSLIFGKKYAQSSITSNDVGTVIFDTMVTEEHRFSSRVTFYPVESGTIVSDHIIKQPDVVVLSGLVTDTPLNILLPFNRSIDAFNNLILIHERRLVVDIVTGIKIYKNMVITSLDVPRSLKTGQTLTFNIELQRIIYSNDLQLPTASNNIFAGIQDNTPRIIVAENTNIPIIQNDPAFSLKDQAETAQNVGVQSLTPVPTSTLPNVLKSLLQTGKNPL